MPFPPNMNFRAMASTLAHEYGINLANPAQLRRYENASRAALDTAYDAVDEFRPLFSGAVNGAFSALFNFLRFLDHGANPGASILALRQINLAFGIQAAEF